MKTLPALPHLLAAMVALLPASGFAFDLEHDASGASIRWPSQFVLSVDAHARDLDSDEVMAAVQRAASHWSAVAGVTIEVEAEHGHGKPGYDPSKEEKNRSELIFVDDDWEYDDSVVATTLVTSDSATHQILDADIMINESQHRFGILPDDSQPGQGLRDDLEGAITHELGHALGLGHNPDVPEATMFPSTQPGAIGKRQLATDDIDGVQQLYGTATAPRPIDEPAAGCNAGVGSDGLLALLALAMLGLRKRARKAAVVALVAAAAVPGVARADAVPEMELQGQVLRADSYWRNGRIYTDVTVQVSSCESGACGTETQFRVPGGTVGRICQQLGDLRVPEVGERVEVKLVRARDGALRPLSAGALARLPSSAAPDRRTNAR